MVIVHYALQALRSLFKPGYRYKKAGVIVSGIQNSSGVQTALFDTVNRNKHSLAMAAMDIINDRFGPSTIKLAAQGTGRKWRLRQEKLSPFYTTRWDQLITVNAER